MAIKTKTEELAAGTAETAASRSGTEQASIGTDRSAAALPYGMARVGAGIERTQSSMKEGVEKMMRTAEDFMSFGQGNLEACLRSGQIWAAGVQDISKQVAATAQAQFEETISAFKALTAIRSVKDAIDVQANLARATIEKTMAESGRITESSMKLTEQVLAPLTARVTLAVEKFAKPV
jgi:phasin family protein